MEEGKEDEEREVEDNEDGKEDEEWEVEEKEKRKEDEEWEVEDNEKGRGRRMGRGGWRRYSVVGDEG